MTGSRNKKDGLEELEPTMALSDRPSHFFEEFFQKGAEFARALIDENEELRRRLNAAEAHIRVADRDALDGVQSEIELEHYNLACLFVAQGQLARARDAGEVIGVIAEILLNFVGADRFAIYASDKSADPAKALRPLFAAEVELDGLPKETPRRLVKAFKDDVVLSAPLTEVADWDSEPLLAVPLRCNATPFGGIAIWGFLGQKKSLEPVNHRLLEVIADVGGCALETARIRGQHPRIAGRADHYNGLALLLGLGGRGG